MFTPRRKVVWLSVDEKPTTGLQRTHTTSEDTLSLHRYRAACAYNHDGTTFRRLRTQRFAIRSRNLFPKRIRHASVLAETRRGENSKAFVATTFLLSPALPTIIRPCEF